MYERDAYIQLKLDKLPSIEDGDHTDRVILTLVLTPCDLHFKFPASYGHGP